MLASMSLINRYLKKLLNIYLKAEVNIIIGFSVCQMNFKPGFLCPEFFFMLSLEPKSSKVKKEKKEKKWDRRKNGTGTLSEFMDDCLRLIF